MSFSLDIGSLPPEPPHRIVRYSTALAAVVVATLIRLGFDPLVHDQIPYFVYVGSAVVATWLAGREAGIAATLAATVVGNYFFVPPRYDLSFRWEDAAAMSTFSVFSLGLVWVVGRWRAAEQHGRQRAEELEKVLDAAPAAIFVTRDPAAHWVDANPYARRCLGALDGNVSKTPAPGEPDAAFRVMKDGREVPPDALPLQRTVATGAGVPDWEFDVIRADGTTRTLLGSTTPLRDESGGVRGAVATFIDITERRLLEGQLEQTIEQLERRVRELAESEERYRIMGETLPYGVWLCGPDGGARYTSDSFLELLGMTMEETRQFGWTRRLVPEDVEPMMKKWLHCIATGEMWDSEHRVIDRHGRVRTVLTRGLPVRNEQGEVTCWVGVNLDITDRKRMERRLQEQADALERANRVKDEFLATLSHELRTPLNAILGWSDMLLRPGLSGDVQRKALESINRNARAQSALISDILDVSRVITGKLRLDLRPVDLGDVVRAACESVRPAAEAKGIEILTHVDERALLIGDHDRLQQILWNLLSNAVKFCDKGGKVAVDVHRVNSHATIAVKDDGSGIPAEFLPHVFERFTQLDSSTTRPQSGLGLGLAIVRSLAELHGGTVAADSEGAGRGATFTVTLPVRAVFEANGEAERILASRPDRSAVEPACLRSLHVVAVDDQEEARSLVQAVLERYGARVTICSTAEQAIEAVKRERPGMLVADIGMPGIDGYELMRRIRALPDGDGRALPALALTAYGGAHDRAEALAAGFWEHLPKPATADALVKAVASLAARTERG